MSEWDCLVAPRKEINFRLNSGLFIFTEVNPLGSTGIEFTLSGLDVSGEFWRWARRWFAWSEIYLLESVNKLRNVVFILLFHFSTRYKESVLYCRAETLSITNWNWFFHIAGTPNMQMWCNLNIFMFWWQTYGKNTQQYRTINNKAFKEITVDMKKLAKKCDKWIEIRRKIYKFSYFLFYERVVKKFEMHSFS